MPAERGSAPLELILGSLMLLLPLNLALGLLEIQSDQLLAENIGRHALRSAVLNGSNLIDYQRLATATAIEIAMTWNPNKSSQIQLSCDGSCKKGSRLNLIVRVGNATAVQSQVLDR